MSNKETELYLPVKNYLEELGFKVDAEVNGCDIVAALGSDIIIVELKNSFSLKLLYQALERQKLSNLVFVAIANRTARQYPPNIKNIKAVLSKLNIGLLIVHFRKNQTTVEPVIEAHNVSKTLKSKKRRMLLKELDGRYRNFNIGGSPSSKKILTAYMLNTIQIAVALDEYGEATPSQLKKWETSPNTQSILYNNFSNWFDRVKRGTYQLNPRGRKELLDFPEQSSYYRKKLQNNKKNH